MTTSGKQNVYCCSIIQSCFRISLTEKCSLRCRYCMPPEGVQLSKQNELLSVDEITRISKILAEQRCLRKIRLTGGEVVSYSLHIIYNSLLLIEYINRKIYWDMNPQREWTSDSKRDLWNSFKSKRVTKSFPGNHWNNYKWFSWKKARTSVNESLGVALTAKRAEQLFESGLDTVNISMDTLEPMKAEFITRRPSTFHKGRFQYFFCGVFWMIFIVFFLYWIQKREPFSQSTTHWRLGYE